MIEITQEWVDKAKDLAHHYAYDYSLVIPGSHIALFEHLQSAVDPFVEMKQLYARDIESCKDIDGIEAYQLWQLLNNVTEIWEDCATTPYCQDINKYRRHPHADSIILYHKCSAEEKKYWQWSHSGHEEWNYFYDYENKRRYAPTWEENFDYRLRPGLISVKHDNGTRIKIPEPERLPLDCGEAYYINLFDDYIASFIWGGNEKEILWLEQNKIYKTEDDCKAAQSAINKIMSLRS